MPTVIKATVTPNDFPAEMRLFKFGTHELKILVPAPDAIREHYQTQLQKDETIAFPFWSKVWPAALGMCRFLEKHEEVIAGKKVLELAAGLGLPSLMAATFSDDVSCTDYIPDAVQWAKKSAELNNFFQIRHFNADWNRLPADLDCDTLLLSDVNYDPYLFPILKQELIRFLKSGTTVILSTPQRLLAKPLIEQLLPWCRRSEVFEIVLDKEVTQVSVFELAW